MTEPTDEQPGGQEPDPAVSLLSQMASARHEQTMRLIEAMDGGARPVEPTPAEPAEAAEPGAPVVLATSPGAPPLTREMVAAIAGLYGWANEMAVGAPDVADLSSRLAAAWQASDGQSVQAALRAVEVADRCRAALLADPTGEEALRQQARERLWDAQLTETAITSWWFAVSERAPGGGDHDAYIGLANTSLHGYVNRMGSLLNDW